MIAMIGGSARRRPRCPAGSAGSAPPRARRPRTTARRARAPRSRSPCRCVRAPPRSWRAGDRSASRGSLAGMRAEVRPRRRLESGHDAIWWRRKPALLDVVNSGSCAAGRLHRWSSWLVSSKTLAGGRRVAPRFRDRRAANRFESARRRPRTVTDPARGSQAPRGGLAVAIRHVDGTRRDQRNKQRSDPDD